MKTLVDFSLTIASHSTNNWKEVRCSEPCGALLFICKGKLEWIEIKCRRCKRINEIRGPYMTPA